MQSTSIPRIPRFVLAPNLQCGRQDLPFPEARKSTDHQSEQSVQYREPVVHFSRTHVASISKKVSEVSTRKLFFGKVDYRIPGIPQSTVQKDGSNRKAIVERLSQQFENHPNQDSLTEALNKTDEFNPFSEKSKELITGMGNTEYSEQTMPRLRFILGSGHYIYCTRGKCMQPTERNRQLNKARYDVLSIPATLSKGISPQAQKRCYKTILERWHHDDKYRKSLSDIGWTEEQIIQY